MLSRDERLVTGKGRFIDDLEFDNLAHLVFAGSPYAHAEILKIDVSKAIEMPGVLSVITGKEITQFTNPLPVQITASGPGWTYRTPKVYALAVDKVRWFGEPVAAIIANDQNIALEAAGLIDVEYMPLPVLTDPESALKPEAPLVYEEWGSNIQSHVKFDFGDADAAFAEADRTLRVTYCEGRVSGFPIEARGFVAKFDKVTRHLTVWGTFQIPFVARHNLAHTLRLPESRVKAISTDIGGAFGNKMHCWKEHVVALGAIITGKTVKWIESQREWLVTGPHQRDVSWEGEVAFKNDGRVLGLKARIVKDLGVEGSNKGLGAAGVVAACCATANAYRWKGMRLEGIGVVTNKSFYCAYRGYAKDKGIRFIEYVFDRVARETNLRPEEVRLRNFIQPHEFPYRQINNYNYDSGDYPAVLRTAIEKGKIEEWRLKQRELRKEGRYIGVGVAFTVEPAGIAVIDGMMPGFVQARVKINSDGTVEVHTDRTEIGQGAEKSHVLIVSEILGCKAQSIEVFPVTSDTIGVGPCSSRGAVYSASALIEASKMLREKVMKFAGAFLGVGTETLEAVDGVIFSRENPEKHMSFEELARRTYFFPGPRGLPKDSLLRHNVLLDATAEWFSANTAETGSTYTTFCASADVAVVEVDVETGSSRILSYAHAHDAGKIVSKQIVDGQIHGGVLQGIGEALTEELVYSPEGRLLSDSYADYLMPTAVEAPDITIAHLETLSPYSENGSKGMGEAPAIGAKACVLAAIRDALSPLNIPVDRSPATRERVRAWVRDAFNRCGETSPVS
jgi:carbon-monoxide dehydrogenase large subunit